jgi:uncharacterized protein
VRSRRWLIGAIAGVAAVLLVGRLIAGWYADYLWYEALGATGIWRERQFSLVALRGMAFVVGTLFVFANLLAVRHSVASLVLPRRVANLEIGEEVPGRYLVGAVVVLSVVIGLLLALPHDDWISLALVRHGEPFRETDPYFEFDFLYWVAWLPLESAAQLWAMIALLTVTMLVIFLYALTPSLRWEGGRLRVTSYVRRHLFALGATLLALLAWSFRLDAYGLLLGGSGTSGTFSALDHRIGIPANLVLSLVTLVGALLLAFAGWTGQIRLAFATLSSVLVLVLSLRLIVPPLAQRFLTPTDPERRDQPYAETRSGYTRRAYDVDRIARDDSAGAPPLVSAALRGASLWDGPALARALSRSRRDATLHAGLGWEVRDGRLLAVAVEQPVAPDAEDSLAVWRLVRVQADMAEDRGAYLTVPDEALEETTPLARVLVHDSATGYRIVVDTAASLASPTLSGFGTRLAFAWDLQNPALLGDAGARRNVRIVRRRDLRDRLHTLYPYFTQGTTIHPIVDGGSLLWAVDLYTTSDWFPLSERVRHGDLEVRYLRHAAVALVDAHSGRVTTVPDESPDPLATAWIRRFPEQFVPSASVDPRVLRQVPPPIDLALTQSRMFALVGARGEFVPPSRLPRTTGGDTLFPLVGSAPLYDVTTGRLAVTVPILDPVDRLRGIIVAAAGPSPRIRWHVLPLAGPRWAGIVERLQRLPDSMSAAARDGRLVRGAVRSVPVGDGIAMLQTTYVWPVDAAPRVAQVVLLLGDSARAAPTLPAVVGLPSPPIPTAPLTPEEFRGRVSALYAEMRDALRRGDWMAFGSAYEALGRLLHLAPR